MPGSTHVIHPSAADAVIATPAGVARPLGATLLRIALVAVLGPPIAVLVALGALLALVMAGSIIAVGAVLFAYGLVALVATGAAG